MDLIKKVSFIGAGNVAWHLSKSLYSKGVDILQVFSRNEKHAEDLAWQVKASPITNLESLNPKVDLLIISVPDDAIESVLSQIPEYMAVVHTSGSIDIRVFENYKSKDVGIFYPLQTFSKNREINFSSIPILLETPSEFLQKNLETMADKISSHVGFYSSEDRAKIHIAAVFASNFTNELLGISNELLKSKYLNFNILKPLVEETVAKAFSGNPRDFQTGPAVRHDLKTIAKQKESLDDKRLQELYELFTQQIIEVQKRNG